MRKSAFCICENKGTDQLRGYLLSSMAVQPGFVLDLLGNPVDRFSRDKAHIAGDARYLFLRSIIPDLFALMYDPIYDPVHNEKMVSWNRGIKHDFPFINIRNAPQEG